MYHGDVKVKEVRLVVLVLHGRDAVILLYCSIPLVLYTSDESVIVDTSSQPKGNDKTTVGRFERMLNYVQIKDGKYNVI